MASAIPNFHPRRSGEFRKVVDAFLGHDGLPFAEILSAQRIEEPKKGQASLMRYPIDAPRIDQRGRG